MNKKEDNNTRIKQGETPAPRKVYDLNEHQINKIKCSISGRANSGSLGSDLMSV